MAIPLYQQERWSQVGTQGAHPGLLFDKFIREWSDSWGKLGTDAKQKFFKRIIRHAGNVSTNIETGLQNAHQRQEELVVKHLKGERHEFQTVWRFVSGLGAGHPFESGFIWHRTLGVPYLPGSSIKGMMRAWATRWLCGEEDADEEQIRRRVERLFGPENVTDQGGDCGAFIAFDALPVAPPELELDILNPHYQPYYEDPALPPADYYSPVPVFFLTVAPGQRFSFALAPRRGAKLDDEDLEWLWSLLAGALREMGAGGKTAVGYGTMSNPDKKARQWLEKTLEMLRSHKDYRGLPEENLWKKPLSGEFLRAPADIVPNVREIIKAQWRKFGIDWNNPPDRNSRQAKRNYESR